MLKVLTAQSQKSKSLHRQSEKQSTITVHRLPGGRRHAPKIKMIWRKSTHIERESEYTANDTCGKIRFWPWPVGEFNRHRSCLLLWLQQLFVERPPKHPHRLNSNASNLCGSWQHPKMSACITFTLMKDGENFVKLGAIIMARMHSHRPPHQTCPNV